MIDSHCHLTDPRLASQLDGVMERAGALGVSRMITIGTDLADARAAVAVCRGRENVRCAIGIHPNHAHEASEEDLLQLRELQKDPSVVALGEMGLDYFHQFAQRDRQRDFFVKQLELAREARKPVVIHCREAVNDTLAIMKDFPEVRAVFHCFTGTMEEAERILAAGYYMGFTGPITYKKNDALRHVVRHVPMNRLLVETDAPYLSPEPVRSQKTCEPAFVMHTAAMVARVKMLRLEDVDRMTSENVRELFNWGDDSCGFGSNS